MRVVLLVVALKLAAWLLSGAGVHLLAARLLRAALDAVWEEHGEAMAEALADAPIHRWFDALPDDDIHDEDIPF